MYLVRFKLPMFIWGNVLEKTVTEMSTGCLKTMKSCHICKKYIMEVFKLVIKYGTLSIYSLHLLIFPNPGRHVNL